MRPEWLDRGWAGARLAVLKGCCRAFALAGAAPAAIPKGAGPEFTPKGATGGGPKEPSVVGGAVPGCEGLR